MYADYIEHQGGDENSIISAEHIDVLTFNRIDFEKLSEMQKRIIGRVHSRLTAFEEENADLANKLKEHPMWKEFDARCIGCGSCVDACKHHATGVLSLNQNGKID